MGLSTARAMRGEAFNPAPYTFSSILADWHITRTQSQIWISHRRFRTFGRLSRGLGYRIWRIQLGDTRIFSVDVQADLRLRIPDRSA